MSLYVTNVVPAELYLFPLTEGSRIDVSAFVDSAPVAPAEFSPRLVSEEILFLEEILFSEEILFAEEIRKAVGHFWHHLGSDEIQEMGKVIGRYRLRP